MEPRDPHPPSCDRSASPIERRQSRRRRGPLRRRELRFVDRGRIGTYGARARISEVASPRAWHDKPGQSRRVYSRQVTYLLAPIGTRDTTEGEVEAVIEHHLHHPAFWSAIRHDSWAKGSRVVAKMTGVGLLVLTGTLDCSAPAHDPLEVGGQIWEWRYAMRWDRPPRRTVPVGELGVPFDQPTRTTKRVSRENFNRAYRALHGRDPTPQVG
jgi:hypothetical protein